MGNHAANELFAKKGAKARPRRIEAAGLDVTTHGMPRAYLQDVYHYAMTLSWPAFMGICAAVFVLLNAGFAVLYGLSPGSIANQSPKGFWGAFFFSVETLATVGYGDMHPASAYGHALASVEIFAGMASVALITGVMFARFSRPRARILFAENPVIGFMDGVPTLTVRAANARQNVIVDAGAKLRLIREEVSVEGERIRRIYDLKLRRDQQPMFILGWALMHDIDVDSPLAGWSAAEFASSEASLVLTIDGVDETTSQHMQSRFVYKADEVLWGRRYVDLFYADAKGHAHMDYAHFHKTEAQLPSAKDGALESAVRALASTPSGRGDHHRP